MILTPELRGPVLRCIIILSKNHENYVLKEGDPGGTYM